jgi:hypothetical protein
MQVSDGKVMCGPEQAKVEWQPQKGQFFETRFLRMASPIRVAIEILQPCFLAQVSVIVPLITENMPS